MKKIDDIIDKTIEIFFSKDKIKLYVLILFIIGFFLRLINVWNMYTGVDASGHAVMAYNFVNSGKLTDWGQAVGLWDFLTDYSYKIFGFGDFGARFVSLIFGSFSIILMFLFVKEMFNEKIGLIAAFLLTFSPFHISQTVPEMDVTVMFFIFFSMFLFVKALKQNKNLLFIFSGIMMGIAILIKIYAFLFIPVLLLYAFYHIKKNKINYKIFIKPVLLFLIIAFIFCLIPIIHNYLLYKDKGFMDMPFSMVLRIGREEGAKYHSWDAGWNIKHEYFQVIFGGKSQFGNPALPLAYIMLKAIADLDILIFLLMIMGIFLSFKFENKDYFFLFLFIMGIVFFYMAGIMLMVKHYVFALMAFIPLAALAVNKIALTSARIYKKIDLKIILILILIFQLFWLSHSTSNVLFEKSSMNQLISYKNNHIPEDSIVIVDNRIFQGFTGFMFGDKHYLEANLFPELLNAQEKMNGQPSPTEAYYIECASDDCGWGIDKIKEINQTMETILDYFKNISKLDASFADKNLKKSPAFSFNVYKTSIMLKPQSIQVIDSTHVFFLYPIGYDEKIIPIFDKYETHNPIDKFLDNMAHYIHYIAAILTLISIFILLYLFIEDNAKIKSENTENEAQHNNTSIQ